MTVPIRNLYYVFAYACGLMEGGRDVEVGAEDSPDALDLLARMLVQQLRGIARRGLARDYLVQEDVLAAPRGRIDVQRSVARLTRARGRLACAYDELSVDRPFNQIVKATAKLLLGCTDLAGERRRELAGVVALLRQVSDVRAERSALHRVQLQGDLRRYRGALAVCDLVLGGLLPVQGGGGARFADVLQDDQRMAAVFEEFLRSFYRLEQGAFRVGREVMRWDAVADADSSALLPVMRTDITLRSPGRVVVADAKYYANAFSGAGERPKLRSDHLYQLFSYVEHVRRGPDCRVDGLLVYPVTGEPFSARFVLKDHGMRAAAIDLMLPWRQIRRHLLDLLEPASN